MAPISVFEQRGELAILHKCKKCGFERKNRVADNDNKENLFKLRKEIAEKGSKSILEIGFIFTVKQK